MHGGTAREPPTLGQIRVGEEAVIGLSDRVRALQKSDLALPAGAAPAAGAVNRQPCPVRRIEDGRAFGSVGNEVLRQKSDGIFHHDWARRAADTLLAAKVYHQGLRVEYLGRWRRETPGHSCLRLISS